MKRFAAFVLALMLAILPATAENAYEKLNSMYMEASLLMVEGKYEEAARMFDSLSGYSDSAQMAIYIRCIALAEAGEYQSAIDSLKKLGDFKDALFMADYYKAMQLLEDVKETPENLTDLTKLKEALESCDQAIKSFEQIAVYKDSKVKAEEAKRMMNDIQAKYDKQYAYEKMHRYQNIGACINGAVIVRDSRDKYGMIFADASEYIECKYDSMGSYSEGWIGIVKDGETMFIDKDENVVLNNDMLSDSSASLYCISRFNDSVIASYYGQVCYVDISGRVIKAARTNYVDDLRSIKQDDRIRMTVMPGRGGTYHMLYDTYGYEVSSKQYNSLRFLGEGLAYAVMGDYGYLINMNGETVSVLGENVYVDKFSEGLARVRNKNGMYGFINVKGEVVIPFDYTMAEHSSDQLIYTDIGWINHDNQVVIPSNGNLTGTQFKNGFALIYAYTTGVSTLIDKNTEVILRPAASNKNYFDNGAIVSINDRFGYVDVYNTDGELIYRNAEEAYLTYLYESEYASYSALWYGDYQCGREVEITIGGGYLYVLDNGWLSIYDLNGEKVF